MILEFFIKYKKQDLIKELKHNHSFRFIFKDVYYFTENNFNHL